MLINGASPVPVEIRYKLRPGKRSSIIKVPVDLSLTSISSPIFIFCNLEVKSPSLSLIEKNSKWGKNDHLNYEEDIMSDRGGHHYHIDKKRKEYYDHSIPNCEMDLKKSAFLEPTEENFQLQPRSKSCKLTRWQPKYNHQRSLGCLARLDF